MTRFDAATADERRELFADAIVAHRERGSAFLTIEADPTALAGEPETDEGDGPQDSDLGLPWLQFAEGVVNLDCTDAELESLKALCAEYPAFTIDEISRPEDAEGTNVRVGARADDDRIATFLDAAMRRVYGLSEAYRAWVVAV